MKQEDCIKKDKTWRDLQMIQNIKENGIAEIYTHSEDSFSVGKYVFRTRIAF